VKEKWSNECEKRELFGNVGNHPVGTIYGVVDDRLGRKCVRVITLREERIR
jgi:hypothetical protein